MLNDRRSKRECAEYAHLGCECEGWTKKMYVVDLERLGNPALMCTTTHVMTDLDKDQQVYLSCPLNTVDKVSRLLCPCLHNVLLLLSCCLKCGPPLGIAAILTNVLHHHHSPY